MPRRRTKKDFPYIHYTPDELREYLDKELNQSEEFHNHCQETADQLGIDKQVVFDILFDYAFQTIMLIQKKTLARKRIRIQHFAWLRMLTMPKPKEFINYKKKKS